MAMKRTRTPWMKAEDFGRSLPRGIGINLLVPQIALMEAFNRNMLGATMCSYADEDFAAVGTARLGVHNANTDHSYLGQSLTGASCRASRLRGAGIEMHIYGPQIWMVRFMPVRANKATILLTRLQRQAPRLAQMPYRLSRGARFSAQPCAWRLSPPNQDREPRYRRDIFGTFRVANRILTIPAVIWPPSAVWWRQGHDRTAQHGGPTEV